MKQAKEELQGSPFFFAFVSSSMCVPELCDTRIQQDKTLLPCVCVSCAIPESSKRKMESTLCVRGRFITGANGVDLWSQTAATESDDELQQQHTAILYKGFASNRC